MSNEGTDLEAQIAEADSRNLFEEKDMAEARTIEQGHICKKCGGYSSSGSDVCLWCLGNQKPIKPIEQPSNYIRCFFKGLGFMCLWLILGLPFLFIAIFCEVGGGCDVTDHPLIKYLSNLTKKR